MSQLEALSPLTKEQVASEIRRIVSDSSAADAADLLLSPHADPTLLLLATEDQGPAMWIVNRSDVFTETLQIFARHPELGIARRAQDKIKARQNPSELLAKPEAHTPLSAAQIPDFEVEEILGHPRVSLAAILHFSYALKDEHRASAALSAFRRIVEYPPEWTQEGVSRETFTRRLCEMLLSDPSALVRSYASRFPLIEGSVLLQALAQESNPTVRGRLLQHPHTPAHALRDLAERSLLTPEEAFVEVVMSLDARWPRELRVQALQRNGGGDLPYLAELVHLYYLSRLN